MCGGAIIPDYEPVGNRCRKITASDLWAELDPISDFWSSSSSSSSIAGKSDSVQSLTHSYNKPQKSDSGKLNQLEKGAIMLLYFLFHIYDCVILTPYRINVCDYCDLTRN